MIFDLEEGFHSTCATAIADLLGHVSKGGRRGAPRPLANIYHPVGMDSVLGGRWVENFGMADAIRRHVSLHMRHSHCGDAFFSADEAHGFVGGGFDADSFR